MEKKIMNIYENDVYSCLISIKMVTNGMVTSGYQSQAKSLSKGLSFLKSFLLVRNLHWEPKIIYSFHNHCGLVFPEQIPRADLTPSLIFFKLSKAIASQLSETELYPEN